MENRESKELSEEDDPEEQEEDYDSLVSGPYAHISLENFRKGIQESSAKKKNDNQGSGVKKIEEPQQQKGRRIEVIEPPKHEPPPKPLPAENLKSAMKKRFTGKKGTWRNQKEKSANKWWRKEVTWAPDVYDPTPSSDSHYKGPCPSSWGLNTSEDKKTAGVDKEDDSERVKGYKNVKKSGKNGVKGSGECAAETGMEKHKSGNKKSLKNPQKGDGDGAGGGGGAQGGAKGGKSKDKKNGGGGVGGIGVDRGGEDNGGKGKVKKSGKSKGTRA